MSTKEFPWAVKCDWHVEQTVLPNVRVKMEAQHARGFQCTIAMQEFMVFII